MVPSPSTLLLAMTIALLPTLVVAAEPPLADIFYGSPQSPEEAAPEIPQDLSPSEVDAYVARLSDAQSRRLLIVRLKEASGSEPEQQPTTMDSGSVALIEALQETTKTIGERFAALAEAMAGAPDSLSYALRNLTGLEGTPALVKALVILASLVVAGWLVERAVNGRFSELRRKISESAPETWIGRLGYLLLRGLLDLLGIAAFAATAYGLSFAFYDRFDPLRLFVITYVLVIALIRIVRLLSLLLLAPTAAGIRVLPFDSSAATFLHRRTVVAAGIAIAGLLTSSLLVILGLTPELHQVFVIGVGLTVACLLVHAVWYLRAQVAAALLNGEPASDKETAGFRYALAQGWHRLAIAYLAGTWLVWALNILLGRTAGARAAVISLLIILCVPLVDRALRGLLESLLALRRQGQGNAPADARYFAGIQNCVRVVLLGGALMLLAEAWGLGVWTWLETDAGSAIAEALASIAVTLFAAYIVWQFVKSFVERNLPEAELDFATVDGESGGAAPATRLQTLLPLFQSSVLIALVIMVAMIGLSALGVNIGPLLAGAGVVGIAIGFGAQKLVQDVFSGIFFLIDDAFRMGEYVEVGNMRGTVEKISIRSLRLRHHRGAVQTIPFGEISEVKNYSRDWVIMKLSFRVPYDTDLEKLRKTVKQIGLDMKADPELGRNMLQPLKSQGVIAMEDSAMIVRMKFMCKPGEQWLLRREAFRRVQEALRAAGLRFAHREVIVHTPGVADAETLRQAGAAAVNQLEEERTPPDRTEAS
jgi:small-conductance mechanosensitive channel